MHRGLLVATLLSLLALSTSSVAEAKYYHEEQVLSPDKARTYAQVQDLLNSWSGDVGQLENARKLINGFLASDQFFLPMHLENARRTIMRGYVGGGDVREANAQALKIVQWVQKRDANYVKSYVLAGHIYTNLQDFSEAKKSLAHADGLGTDDPWLYINWATLLGAQGRYKEAAKYYQRAISLDGINDKALLAAMVGVSNIQQSLPSVNYSDIVFESFDDPSRRVKFAQRLIVSYQGRAEVLQLASEILSRQKEETPELTIVDVEVARLTLYSGLMSRSVFRTLYVPENAQAAQDILLPLWGGKYSADVFDMLFDVAMSEEDYKAANKLLVEAVAFGVPEARILYSRSLIHFKNGEYQDVVSLHKKIEQLDPKSYEEGELVSTAYLHLGDVGKLQKFHLREIERSPNSAWLRGNYAIFLMYYVNDSLGAIHYGESALKIMDYPAGRSITGLAYLAEASKNLSQGNVKLAKSQHDRASALGVSDQYIRDYCYQNCIGIAKVKKKFSAFPVTKK